MALIVAIDAFEEGYKFFEIAFLTLITFFGSMISLLLALSQKERRQEKNYEEERNRYLYQENNPHEYQS